MLHTSAAPPVYRTKRAYIGTVAICLLALAIFFFPQRASAQTTDSGSGAPRLAVTVGFGGNTRMGVWTPIQVALTGGNSDFNGTISIDVPTDYYGGNGAAPTNAYKATINLPAGGQKLITLYAPFPTSIQGTSQSIILHLLDANGHTVVSQEAIAQVIPANDVFVGILSSQNRGFGALSGVSLGMSGGHVDTTQLDATTFPTQAQVLKNFDLLVLDNFTTGSLSHDQLNALQQWVNQGGSLVVVGGPEWAQTQTMLPAGLLPVTISGTTTLPANTTLLPLGGPSRDGPGTPQDALSVPSDVTVSTASVQSGATTLLSAGTTPLQVEANRGQGHVFYLAYDPALTPLTSWTGASDLWSGLLYRTLGDLIINNPTGGVPRVNFLNNGGVDNTLLMLLPNTLPAIWLILILLVAYLLIIGPIRLLIVRRLKKRSWSWRILLSSIVVFSLLSYGLVLMQKGTSVISDTVSLVQLGTGNGTSTTAHITTLVGVYVPNQGDFHVHMAGNALTQPGSNPYSGIGSSGNATVTTAADGSEVDLQGVNTWTLRSVKSEQDSQLSGTITSHLAVSDNVLAGTITNTLPYTLSDAYVLIGDQIVHVGTLAAGASVNVRLTLIDDQISGMNAGQYQQQPLIINQIAADKGLANSPYGYGSQGAQNEDQRHLSILAMMSGQGQYMMPGCLGKACAVPSMGMGMVGSSSMVVVGSSSMVVSVATSNGAFYSFSGGGPFSPYMQGGHDPLLLSNASASLIGWTNQAPTASTGVTINGSHVGGLQETLIQAPLSVDFSQGVHVPGLLIHGQVVSTSGTNSLQTFTPGLYTMQSGSMTFEYKLPATFAQSQHSVSMSEPANLAQFTGKGPGNGQTDANSLQVNIYNWQSGKWESFAFLNLALTLSNTQPYVDATGRMLLQLVVPNSSQNTNNGGVSFITPQVQIQG